MLAILFFSLPIVLVGCGDKDSDTGGAQVVSDYEIDHDGDGLSEAEGDCDDDEAAVYPGAAELCDGLDNDCNGSIDDGAGDLQVFYTDRDADGAGDGESPVEACAPPPGASPNPGDCDDLDAAVHPQAQEVCNGLDDDCDGLADDADDSLDPGTETAWYTDADGDGHGDPGAGVGSACEAPAGAVASDDDCDDSNPVVNPSQRELCDFLDTDEDCDGLVNDADDDIYVGSQTWWYSDADHDGYGDLDDPGFGSCEDWSGDGLADLPGDCADDDALTHPGAEELCGDGVVNDCDSTEADAEAFCAWGTDFTEAEAAGVIVETEDDTYAYWGAAGDLDGDGIDDLVVGVPWSSQDDSDGVLYALMGPLTGGDMETADDVMVTADEGQALGLDPAIGDVDGDGFDDVWVGAPSMDTDDANEGAAYLLYGPLSSTEVETQAALRVLGADRYAYLGTAQGIVGDHDGDGLADLASGASGTYGDEDGSGAIYLFSSAGGADQDLDDALAVVHGDQEWETLGGGGTLGGATDLNGDGQADLVVGSPDRDDEDLDSEGGVFVFYGPVSGELNLGDADAMLYEGVMDSEQVGRTLLTGTDWDGDGAADLVIGDPMSDGDETHDQVGMAYIAVGPMSGQIDLGNEAWLTVSGDEEQQNFGGELSAGDFDGNGQVDLLIGSGWREQTSNSASANDGRDAWIHLGPSSGSLTSSELSSRIEHSEREDGFGLGTVALGDQDGDGSHEALIHSESEGAWYLFTTPGF